jgi:hypothetical protein
MEIRRLRSRAGGQRRDAGGERRHDGGAPAGRSVLGLGVAVFDGFWISAKLATQEIHPRHQHKRVGDGGGGPRGGAFGARRRTVASADGEEQGAGTRADGTGVLLTLRRSSGVAPS